ERQPPRASVPGCIRKGAKTARHSRVTPALVHAADEHRIGLARKLARREAERIAELLAVVEAGRPREQVLPPPPNDRAAVREPPRCRSRLDEHRALDADHREQVTRRTDRVSEAKLDVTIDPRLAERNDAGEHDHLPARVGPLVTPFSSRPWVNL